MVSLHMCHKYSILSGYLEKLSRPAGVSSGVHITKEPPGDLRDNDDEIYLENTPKEIFEDN